MLRRKNDREQERMIKHYIKCCHLGNMGERHTGINSLYYFCNFTVILKLFKNKDFFKKKKSSNNIPPTRTLVPKAVTILRGYFINIYKPKLI